VFLILSAEGQKMPMKFVSLSSLLSMYLHLSLSLSVSVCLCVCVCFSLCMRAFACVLSCLSLCLCAFIDVRARVFPLPVCLRTKWCLFLSGCVCVCRDRQKETKKEEEKNQRSTAEGRVSSLSIVSLSFIHAPDLAACLPALALSAGMFS